MIENKIKTNFPLAQFSTFKIGGPAEFFVELETKEEVEEAWNWAKEKNVDVTVLGGGSNVLISDNGIKGLVIKLHNQKLEFSNNEVLCGAGVIVWDLVARAFEKDLSGIEWSIGIPGSVGGAIRGNAGAHGGSYDKVIQSVLVFDSVTSEWKTFENKDCGFEYRSSRFKTEPHYIIWEVNLKLSKIENKSEVEKIILDYKKYRTDSQPKEPSAGCIFKNLFISDIEAANPELAKQIIEAGKVRGGKVGAGYLVEKLGLKGAKLGGAQVSEKHANFIVNSNNAKASDVHELAQDVKTQVFSTFNIPLEEEVQLLGF